MNADIFQAALAATARVACCAVLVSCQKPTKTPENPSPQMEHATQQEEKPVIEDPEEPKISRVARSLPLVIKRSKTFFKIDPAARTESFRRSIGLLYTARQRVDERQHFAGKTGWIAAKASGMARSKSMYPWGLRLHHTWHKQSTDIDLDQYIKYTSESNLG